jgi:peptidoglycan/LPS O-acetylase OafA/YrhL
MINLDKLKLLHAIRGFAAFYVVVYHAKFILWCGGTEYIKAFPRESWNILNYLTFGFDMLSTAGQQMVIIFFVLSGFFIAYSFDKNKQSSKDFYINRAIRIYVPYLSSVVLGILVLYAIGIFNPDLYHVQNGRELNTRLISAYHDLTLSNFLKSLVFLQNSEYIGFNFAYWSLLYEGIFYLIVPFMIPRPNLYFYLSLFLFLIGLIAFPHAELGVLGRFVFSYNIYFATGQILYKNIGDIRNKVIALKGSKIYLQIISFALLFLMIAIRIMRISDDYCNILAGTLCCFLIILFISFDFPHNMFLAVVKKLGEVSFSLYLIHLPILILLYAVINKLSHQLLIYRHIYPIGVLCAVLFSFVFYKWIEEPSQKLIRKIKGLRKQVA